MIAVGIVPARGGSKGLPGKHVLPVRGKPVLAYTLEAARAARSLARVIVSTDDAGIAAVATAFGAEVIDRPAALATDTASFDDALRHAVRVLAERDGFHPDVVVAMQGNVPIRAAGTIDRALEKLEATGADTVATGYEVSQRPEWMKRLGEGDRLTPFLPPSDAYRRQDLPRLFLLDGAVIAVRTATLLATESDRRAHAYMGPDVRLLEQNPIYAAELDEPSDLRRIESLLEAVERLRKA